METEQKQNVPEPVRNGLAVVGFVTLIVAGMALAVYGARFVPAAVGNISGAAVSLISVFIPNEEPVTPVVIEVPALATTTTAVATTTATSTVTASSTTPTTSSGHEVVNVYNNGGTPIATELYGSPDLTISVLTVGYLTSSNKAFVESREIPADAYRVVFKFLIQNRGTNVAEDGWRFSAAIPSRADKTFRSDTQQKLLPGERIEYTLGFERPIVGKNQAIAITVDADKDTNSANDTATALINVAD